MTAPSAAAAQVFSLAGRTALVTGASGGLGARFARILAARGARVVVAARRIGELEAVAAQIADAGGEALAIQTDVTDGTSVDAGFDAAEAHFGTVDLLINNAGIAHVAGALELTEADWRRVMEVNLDAAFRVTQAAARRMVDAQTSGSIVNIASSLGLDVQKGVAAYAASKAGLIQLTRALALEFARHRIRVNALAPGYIETEMNREFLASSRGRHMIRQLPQKRVGRIDELDGPLLLLASEAGRYMTGQTIVADGGHALCMP